MHGYLVRQPWKHVVPGRSKTPEEEVDLVAVNPRGGETRLPSKLVWTSEDLRTVPRAVIAVRGWHTERFYTSTFEQTPDILRFAEPDSLKFAREILGPGPIAKILCLPRLPASGDVKEQTIAMLRSKGVDGALSFETILAELVARVEPNRNYEKSSLLQVIRILKSYDLVRGPQMDLFIRGRRRRSAGKARRGAEAPPAGQPPKAAEAGEA